MCKDRTDTKLGKEQLKLVRMLFRRCTLRTKGLTDRTGRCYEGKITVKRNNHLSLISFPISHQVEQSLNVDKIRRNIIKKAEI